MKTNVLAVRQIPPIDLTKKSPASRYVVYLEKKSHGFRVGKFCGFYEDGPVTVAPWDVDPSRPRNWLANERVGKQRDVQRSDVLRVVSSPRLSIEVDAYCRRAASEHFKHWRPDFELELDDAEYAGTCELATRLRRDKVCPANVEQFMLFADAHLASGDESAAVMAIIEQLACEWRECQPEHTTHLWRLQVDCAARLWNYRN